MDSSIFLWVFAIFQVVNILRTMAGHDLMPTLWHIA
jgi:hypothetical protein